MNFKDLLDKVKKSLERVSEWALGLPVPVPVPVKSGKKGRAPR